MALPRFVDVDHRRYLWRDLGALHRAQAPPAEQQPALFTLHDDHRPVGGERTAAERYSEPSLFTVLERSRLRFSLSFPLFDAPQAAEIYRDALRPDPSPRSLKAARSPSGWSTVKHAPLAALRR